MEKTTARPLALVLTVAGALLRLAPHPMNFAAVGGVSLFAGARLRGWQAYLVPLVVMAITDPFKGGFGFITFFVYASFLINVWIGRHLRNSENPWLVAGAAAAGSFQFFLVTNLGVWLGSTRLYAHTFGGLIHCYTMALPFYGRTLASDLMYSAL